MCFELLGFDVIIDSKFNPILLEVLLCIYSGKLHAKFFDRHSSGQPHKEKRHSRHPKSD